MIAMMNVRCIALSCVYRHRKAAPSPALKDNTRSAKNENEALERCCRFLPEKQLEKNAAQRLRQKSAFVLEFLAAEAVPDFTKHPHDSVGVEAVEGIRRSKLQ
jgi:hypothetical protein